MINTPQQREKICRMKLQTAKVLWHEGRQDATFLLLESLDDPRADALRERMGFSEDYDVGMASRHGKPSRMPLVAGAVFVASIFFLAGFFISPQIRVPIYHEATQATALSPTPITEWVSPLEDPVPLDLTMTVLSGQPTLTALETQQSNLQANIALSSTARYRQATATAEAQQTQVAEDG
ncbi:MAG: hypothetical protein AAFV98_20190 [Chloroflexota bacterium]